MATGQNLIDAAMAYSTANDPVRLASTAEMIRILNSRARQLVSEASQVKKDYFGTSVSVAAPGAGDGWAVTGVARPRVYLIQMTYRGELKPVHRVKLSDPDWRSAPSVFFQDGKFYSVQAHFSIQNPAPDPAADALVIYYSREWTNLADENASTPSWWPEQFNELLAMYLAKYLAVKDKRTTDVAAIGMLEQDELTRFVKELQSYDAGTPQRVRDVWE